MLIDSHCHLHDPAYEDLRGTLSRASEHGVWGAVAVGCDHETNVRTLKAATASGKAVWPAMGFHPEWHHLTDEDLSQVESQLMANHAWLVALGEVGLPWYSLEGAADAAERMTRARRHLGRLLDLARRYDLAVILHAPHGAAIGALEALKAHVEAVPLSSLLVESDGPWPYKGEFEGMPSGPWLVTRVAEEIAKIKRMPVDEVITEIGANTCALFDLPWS